MNEELKNCMFCGSDRVEAIKKTSAGPRGVIKVSYYVKCHACRARGPAFSCGPELAVCAWNGSPRPGEV